MCIRDRCNTATSAAVRILRQKYPNVPIIGIEPALKPAVYSKNHPNVIVMATPMTIREEKFHNLMERYMDMANIIPMPCPGLMEYKMCIRDRAESVCKPEEYCSGRDPYCKYSGYDRFFSTDRTIKRPVKGC